MPTNSRRDPGRRERIIRATLAVIAREGVEETSLRKVSAEAQVPLGSVTYYFDDRAQLIGEALTAFTTESAAEFRACFDGVRTLDGARRALVEALSSSATTTESGVSLSVSTYALALRRPRYRAIFQRWLRLCREPVARFFDPQTTLMIDAFYEGLLVHRFFETESHGTAWLTRAVERLTPPESFLGPQA